MEKTREQIAQTQLSNSINCFNFDNKKFVEEFARDHPTLQQTFTSLCLEWIEYVGSPEYYYDGRNEMSHAKCEVIRDFMIKNDIKSKLPMI